MLEQLRGILREKSQLWSLVDVGPLTLRIWGPTRDLPGPGEAITLWTHLTTGDTLTIYGFPDPREREVFLRLLRVPGIGPQTALRILATHSVEEILQAVDAEDVSFFSRISGVGKKRAIRILSELKSEGISTVREAPVLPSRVVDALIHLGFSAQEARQVLRNVMAEDPQADEETLLRKALQKRSPA